MINITNIVSINENFYINKQIILQKRCPQLAKIFKAGQWMRNTKAN